MDKDAVEQRCLSTHPYRVPGVQTTRRPCVKFARARSALAAARTTWDCAEERYQLRIRWRDYPARGEFRDTIE
jgi:hypothetical protein